MPTLVRLAPAAALAVAAACNPDRPVAPVTARTAVAARQTDFTVTETRDLGRPPYTFVTISDINEGGQVVGHGGTPRVGGPLFRRALLWDDGAVRDISALVDSAPVDRLAYAIGEDGVAYGEEYLLTRGARAVVYRAGAVEYLPSAPGVTDATSRARGVNAAGDVVGETFFLIPSPNRLVLQAALWRNGTPLPLGALIPGGSSVAYAVNDRGQAVGASRAPSGRDHAVLFENGRVIDLGTLPGHTRSVALGINNRGQIVGYSTANDTTPEAVAKFQRAVLWEDGRVIDLGALAGGGLSLAHAINEAGQIVGNAATGGVVWQRGVAYPLPALAPGTSAGAFAINNRGQVAGTSGGRVVRWTVSLPAPAEPGPNTPPSSTGLRPEPASGAFSVGAKACGGRYTACVRFSIADPDADDAPFRAALDWGDGSRWAPNPVPQAGVPLLAPHNYAEPGTYTVRVTVADRHGAASTEAVTLYVAP